MSDLRESIGGFLGSSTIQVRDSSPSGQNEDAVEAMLVPEGEVSFSQGSLDEAGVTMQNVQLVGDNLVLMDGDMIVSEESGAILVQNGMYVNAEQMNGQSEQMITYIPESVPDQGQSLVIEESETGIQRLEDSIQVEEGIYEMNAAVRDEVAPRVEDQRIDEVPTASQHPDGNQAALVGFDVQHEQIEDTNESTFAEVESDRILLQEVPEQTVVEMQTLIMEQMATNTGMASQSEQLDENDTQQVQDEQLVQSYADQHPVLEHEAPSTSRPRFHEESPVEPMLYNNGSAQNESDQTTSVATRAQDQELQVVPDSSETVPSKTFLNENLHESMDGSTERISPAATSMGIQMVPSSSENSRDMLVLHKEDALLQDTIYPVAENVTESEEQTGNLSELNEPEDAATLRHVLVWQGEEEGQQEEQGETRANQSEIGLVEQHNQQFESNNSDVEKAQFSAVSDQSEINLMHMTQNDQAEELDESASRMPDEQLMLVESVPDENTQDLTRVFQVAESIQEQAHSKDDAEQGYEMCIALADGQDSMVEFPQEGGGRTITVPFNIGGQVQEIPIQIPDWADLSQQSLVAVTEDGTHIPLTFVQEEEDEGGEQQQQHIEVHLDTEMLSSSQQGMPLDENELITIQDSESGMILAQDGENQYEVINMMDSQDYEIQDGVIHLVQNRNGQSASGAQALRRVEMDSNNSPATSVTPFYFDGSGMAIHEQSILPDSPEELTNVIQIPEDAFLSSQPIELQMVEVPGGRIVHRAGGRGGIVRRAATPRGAQRKRRPYQRNTPRQPRRAHGSVSATESQKAIRSIGQPDVAHTQQSAPLNEQHYVAIQEDILAVAKDTSSQIELSNETPSVISPENMQALIQVLQSLPNTARGQTIQIVLQNDPFSQSAAPDEDQARMKALETTSKSASSLPHQTSLKEQQIKIVHMPMGQTPSKTTSDIAVQVTPNFLQNSSEVSAAAIPEDGNDGTIAVAENASALQKTTTITVLTEDIVPQSCINMLMEDDSFLFGTGKTSKKQKTATKRKNPKKIVTVEEVQYMIDPKPGVSYYAVVDYMSEHDQDGFSSASEMRRPEPQFSGFMEDHLELQSTTEQTNGRSILESTVDSTVTMTPHQQQRRKYNRSSIVQQPQDTTTIDLPLETDQTSVTMSERTYEQAMLEEDLVANQPVQQLRRRKRSRVRAIRPVMERFEHRCGYCEFGSTDKILVVEHCISEHPSLPVKTLSLLPQMSGRMCPYCQQTFDHMEFFAHMRFAHNEVHPFKCGYCEFMGRDRNQVRHHIQKKHRLPMKVINLLDSNKRLEDAESRCSGGSATGKKRIMAYSEGEDTVYEYLTDEEEMEDNDSDNTNSKRDLVCPECKRAFKTLKYLKTHIKIHQSLRYQCSYCDFISVMLHQVIRHCQKKHVGMAPKVLTKELDPDKYAVVSRDMESVIEKVFALNTRLPRDPDAAKWMRKWFCPHCDYACQFGASYRRHLRMHANILPFKCNYCSFKGREKYYVRRHIDRMHKDLPMIVVENNPENCARDTSSDEDYQEKGLRRRRRRRTKDAEHAVVPLGHLEDDLLGPHFQKLPVGERGTRGGRLTIDELENEFPLHNVMRAGEDGIGGYRSRATGIQKMSRSKLWSEENLDNYIKEQIDDIIVCKICGERTHEKVFHKHARKHFKLRPLKCGYCNYMSMEMSKIRSHNNLKHPNAPLKLEECHLASVTPEDFLDLIGGDDLAAVATGDIQENDPLTAHFECPFCQVTLAYTERCLQEHFYTHYDYYPFKCSECGFQATSEQKVVEHGASHDNEIVVFQIELDKPSGLEETIQQFMREGEQIAAQRVNDLLEQSAAPRVAAAEGDRGVMDGEETPSGLTVSIFQCPVCDQQMTLHEVMVRRHLYVHYSYKPFKCGYCNYRGISKGSIKQHTSVHGTLKPKIGLSEDAMPEDLAKILRHIRSVMKLSPEKMESAVIPNEETVRLAEENEDPLTVEGKRWKEMLVQGQCPWCNAKVGGPKSKLHSHLLGHFSSSPFQCGHCEEKFSSRREANQHTVKYHPEEEPKIVEVIDDEVEMRKGLVQFMKSKRTLVGAHSLMKNTSVEEEKVPLEGSADSQETLSTIEEEMRKLIGEGKEFQYQVVIMNEDGTMETMEVTAQQPLTEVGLVEDGKDPAARDIPTPTIMDEEAGKVTEMDALSNTAVESTVEKIATPDDRVSSAEVSNENIDCGLKEFHVAKTAESFVGEAGKKGEDAEPESAKSVDVETKFEQSASVCADAEEQDKKAATKEKTEEASGEIKDVAKEAPQSDEEQKERDDFDAEIVTVDRVLLTRSFRSETEDSGEDDNPMDSMMSPAGSSNGSVNSDEDDDDDEMLAIGPSLEFVGDIISLLKHSSAAIQTKKPPKVYKFMCQHCGVTFPRSATLQKHIAKEHEQEDNDAAFHHDHCEYEENDKITNLNSSKPTSDTSVAALEVPQASTTQLDMPLLQEEPMRGSKRIASGDADTHREVKRSKTSLENTQPSIQTREIPARGQKRNISEENAMHREDKRQKIAPEASAPGLHEIDTTISVQELNEQDNVAGDQASLSRTELDESKEEEETIENITKMVQEGEASAPSQKLEADIGLQEAEKSEPAKNMNVDSMDATSYEEQTFVQSMNDEPELAHKSAPSRLEASKRENLKKMLEQEVTMATAADILSISCAAAKEDPVPLTPPVAETSSPQHDSKSVPLPSPATVVSSASKPSRLEAYKLEALRKAQSNTTVTDTPTSKGSKLPTEEAKTLPPLPTRKSTRVTRLSKRMRRLSESASSAAVQIGKYKLRGKARKDEATPASKKSKAGKAAAKSLMKAKASATKVKVSAMKAGCLATKSSSSATQASSSVKKKRSSLTKMGVSAEKMSTCATKVSAAETKSSDSSVKAVIKTETSKDEMKRRPKSKEAEPVEASSSQRAVQCEVTEGSVDSNLEVGLEGLENLEECDENLPKILQILQLRPTKDQEKS